MKNKVLGPFYVSTSAGCKRQVFVLSVLGDLAFGGVRIGSLLCEVFAWDPRCVGNAGTGGRGWESSAGKVRGGWMLVTWGRNLFLSPLKRAVCLGQCSIGFWSGWAGQEVMTGCTRKLGSSGHSRDIKKSQWKCRDLYRSNFPNVWNLSALTPIVMDTIFWGVAMSFILWCLLLSLQVQDLWQEWFALTHIFMGPGNGPLCFMGNK